MSSSHDQNTSPLTGGMIALFALASGLAVANIYYAQPLIAIIAPDLHMASSTAGLIVAFTQIGYGIGLLFLVPLSDVVENRRLTVRLLIGVVLGLVGIAVSYSKWLFLGSCALVGICAVAAQVLVPMASHLAPASSRGRVVGNVMGGLIAGIMLARPFSSFVADMLGWRAVFWLTAMLVAVTAVALHVKLTPRHVDSGHRYVKILASLPGIVTSTSILRRRALYQGMMFAAFNLFWTGVPLLLIHEFDFSQWQVALFALAGAGGALAAPFAGRLADKGLTTVATGAAIFLGIASFLTAGWAGYHHAVIVLVISGILLDAAVQTCQVLSLRSIYMLAPELRGRLNGLFMTGVFICGALGSGLSAALYAYAGWKGVVALGALCPCIALLRFAIEIKQKNAA